MNFIELFVFGTAISFLNVIFQIFSHNSTVTNNLLRIKQHHVVKLNATSQLFAPLGGLFLVPFISVSYAILRVKKRIILKMIFMEFLLAILSLLLIALTTGLILYSWFGNNVILESTFYLQEKHPKSRKLVVCTSSKFLNFSIYTKKT